MENDSKNIFSLRKLSIGLASVMLSTCFFVAQKGEDVKADTISDNSEESISNQNAQNTEAMAQKQADASNIDQKATVVSADNQASNIGTKSEDTQTVDNVKSQLKQNVNSESVSSVSGGGSHLLK